MLLREDFHQSPSVSIHFTLLGICRSRVSVGRRGEPPDEFSGIETAQRISERISIPTGAALGDRQRHMESPPRTGQRCHTETVAPLEHTHSGSERSNMRAHTQPSQSGGSGGRKNSTGSPNRLAGIMKELLGMNTEQSDSEYDGEDILEVAREVTKSQSSQIIAWWGTRMCLKRLARRATDCRRWATPRGFPDSEEEDFIHWFHCNYSCVRRWQAFIGLILYITYL